MTRALLCGLAVAALSGCVGDAAAPATPSACVGVACMMPSDGGVRWECCEWERADSAVGDR